jgi:hypothetical protein
VLVQGSSNRYRKQYTRRNARYMLQFANYAPHQKKEELEFFSFPKKIENWRIHRQATEEKSFKTLPSASPFC